MRMEILYNFMQLCSGVCILGFDCQLLLILEIHTINNNGMGKVEKDLGTLGNCDYFSMWSKRQGIQQGTD